MIMHVTDYKSFFFFFLSLYYNPKSIPQIYNFTFSLQREGILQRRGKISSKIPTFFLSFPLSLSKLLDFTWNTVIRFELLIDDVRLKDTRK